MILLSLKPLYVRYFMVVETMIVLIDAFFARKQDAAKYVATIIPESAKSLRSHHTYVTGVQRKLIV
jgi:hypothetical protein